MEDLLNRINELIRIEVKTDAEIQQVLGKKELADVIHACDDAFSNPVAKRAIYPELLDKISEHGICIYAHREEIMGYCAFYANDSKQGNAYISLLAVRPEYQHMHIGAELLQEAFVIMRSCGMRNCQLEVYKSNRAAIYFYKSMGFGTIEEHGGKYLINCRLDWSIVAP